MPAIVWVLRCAWRMGQTLSMSARREITKKLAGEYGKASKKAKGVMLDPRAPTYGYDTVKLLIQVWNLAGRPSGKYLAATMGIWVPKLEQHGELDMKRLSDHTRAQLLTVSGATIDRILKPTRDGGKLVGLSGTKPGLLLRNSIQVRKAGDEHEQAPGCVEADLVGLGIVTCFSPAPGHTHRTITPTSSRRAVTSCADTHSITAMTRWLNRNSSTN